MKKYLSLFALILVGLSLSAIGCGHKPAYSDIKVEQPARGGSEPTTTENKPADPVAEVDKKAEANDAQNASQPPAQPNQPAAENKTMVMPSFFDTSKNQIRDLPKYPKSQVANMQYGPLQNAMIVFMVLQTYDPVEKVSGFYESELKRNGWTIANNTHDATYYEWSLKKGEANEATVKITKDETNRMTYISLSRSEKQAENKP